MSLNLHSSRMILLGGSATHTDPQGWTGASEQPVHGNTGFKSLNTFRVRDKRPLSNCSHSQMSGLLFSLDSLSSTRPYVLAKYTRFDFSHPVLRCNYFLFSLADLQSAAPTVVGYVMNEFSLQ